MGKWMTHRALPTIKDWWKGIPTDEWCIVQYEDKDGSIHTLIRLKYQWAAQRIEGKWEYVAEGLTEKQAMEFAKLFKGA